LAPTRSGRKDGKVTKEIALHREEGKSIWMLGALMTFKATAAGDGRCT